MNLLFFLSFVFCAQNGNVQTIELGENVLHVFISDSNHAAQIIHNISEVDFPPQSKSAGAIQIPRVFRHQGRNYEIQTLSDYAFYGSHLSSIEFPNTMKEIGEFCFSESKELKTIDLSETKIQYLSDRCFSNCVSLQTVILSTFIDTIGKETFSGCKKLKKIILHSIVDIKEASFKDCISLSSFPCEKIGNFIAKNAFFHSGLETFTINENIQIIEEGIFSHCFNLTHIVLKSTFIEEIPNKLCEECLKLQKFDIEIEKNAENAINFLKIGQRSFFKSNLSSFSFSHVDMLDISSFDSCCHLHSVDLSESNKIKIIPEFCFKNCINLKILILPNSLKVIEAEAFRNIGIESLIFPQKIKELKDGCFRNCEKLSKIEIPIAGSPLYIDDFAFAFCGKLEEISLPETEISFGEHVFEKTFLGKIVFRGIISEIGEYSFSTCKNLKFADLRKSEISLIPRCLFYKCNNLKEVFLSPLTSVIEEYAFQMCSIVSISATKQLQTIGHHCFFKCNALKKVDLKNSQLFSLSEGVFDGCLRLNEINLPTQLINVGKRAFFGTSLKEILFYSDLQTISDESFCDCRKLERINIEMTHLISIGKSSFQNTALSTLLTPHSLKKIGERAFQNTKLTKIILNNEVSEISANCFKNCFELSQININETELSLIDDGLFMNCKEIHSFDLRNNQITSIGSFSFFNTSLEEIFLPETLISIGIQCFSSTLLKTIDFSKTKVFSFPEGVFFQCTNLSKIIFPPLLTEIRSFAFFLNPFQQLTFPEQLTTVSNFAFSWCPFLQILNFSQTLISEFKTKTFSHLHLLNSVILPKTLYKVEKLSFFDCPKVVAIYFNSSNKLIIPKIFPAEVLAFTSPKYAHDFLLGATVTHIRNRIPEIEDLEGISVNLPINCPHSLKRKKDKNNGRKQREMIENDDISVILCENGQYFDIKKIMVNIPEAKENESFAFLSKNDLLKELQSTSLICFIHYHLKTILYLLCCFIYGFFIFQTIQRKNRPPRHVIRRGVVW